MIFQLFAIAKSLEATRNITKLGTTLVNCPLDSIIKDQLTEAESYGLKSVSFTSSEMFVEMNCVPEIAFATAEAVSLTSFRESLKRTKNVHAVVLDESHTVETWTGKRYCLTIVYLGGYCNCIVT